MGELARDGFTSCVSDRGSSAADYCLVGAENLGLIRNFKATTMNESIEEKKLEGGAMRVPDHSLLQRDIRLEGVTEVSREGNPHEVRNMYVVPAD